MIKTQNFSLLTIFSFLLLFTFSCQREDSPLADPGNSPQLSLTQAVAFESNQKDYNFEYTGQVEAGILTTGLNVFNADGQSVLSFEEVQFDTEAENFNQSVADYIADFANSKASLYNPAVIENVSDGMYHFLEEVTEKAGKEQLLEDETQGIFFLYSLLKAIQRNHENGGNAITCSPFEGYALEISSFFLMEDVTIEVADFQAYIASDPDKVRKGAYVFEDVLQQQAKASITLKAMADEVAAYIANASGSTGSGGTTTQSSWWPSGSSHGCCGNYSGPCLYWHWACYVHDKMCTDCTPSWFCLSGCVPD